LVGYGFLWISRMIGEVWRLRRASFRTTASGVRVRIVLVVRRRSAPVCRVMVGLGFWLPQVTTERPAVPPQMLS